MIVEIPNSTSLRWVHVNSDGSALTGTQPNYTNRLQQHFVVPNAEIFEKFIKFDNNGGVSGDVIKTQFTTDATTIEIKVYDKTDDSEVSDESGNESLKYTYTSGLKIYNIDIDVTGYDGQYYIRMMFTDGVDTEYWQCEYFSVDNITDDTDIIKIEWATSSRLGVYNPAEVYGTYYFHLPARFFKINFGEDKKTYVDSDYVITLQDGVPVLNIFLEFGEIPNYIAEKVMLALQHETFKINGVDYQTEDTPEFEIIENGAFTTNLFKGSVSLRKKEYEQHTTTIDDEEPATLYLDIDFNGWDLGINDVAEGSFYKLLIS